jgi:hypothetical protein
MTGVCMSDIIPLLEERLGIRAGFFSSLDGDNENDWSFLIKLHAIVEAAVSHMLTDQLHRPELSDLFARLEISNKTTGKAAFIDALDLLGKSERRFMSSLSELRNMLVHDVRNVDFDLMQYLGGMTKEQQTTFLKNFNLISTEVTDDIRCLFHHDPRQALWYSGMVFLGFVYLKTKTEGLRPAGLESCA